jgi:membrane protease YdiL (CAAX protease family)
MSFPAMLASSAVLSVGLATFVGCPIVWTYVVRRLVSGADVVPFEPRRRAPWVVPFAIILVACLTLALGVKVSTEVHRRWQNRAAATADVEVAQQPAEVVKPSAEQIAIGGLSAEIVILFVIGVVLVVLHVTSGATRADFGLDFRQTAYDIRLGVLAFVAVSVPTYALQALLHKYVMEASHPVTEALTENRSPSLFLAMIALAVFLAPLAEELLFRVLLQGWIEALLAHRSTEDVASPDWERSSSPPVALVANDPAAEVHSHEAASVESAESNEPEPIDTFRLAPEEAEPLITRRVSWAPILITSALFALSHLGNGPSAVPLFFFGLALGYIYQQTHRLLPSLVLHMSLNGFTMLLLMATPAAQ